MSLSRWPEEKFSKVSTIGVGCSQLSSELTFENVYLRDFALAASVEKVVHELRVDVVG